MRPAVRPRICAPHGVDARDVEELTGFPSLFDGRVKTLHPKVFGGILADRSNPCTSAEAVQLRDPADLDVVVNLYPFEETVAREGATLNEAIEQIDIGGVSLMRAAAKNFDHVTVLAIPAQYAEVIAALPAALDSRVRRRLGDARVRAHGRIRLGDRAVSRSRPARQRVAGLARADDPARAAAALRGESAGSRAAFYLAREERLPEQLRRQGALVQQSARSRRDPAAAWSARRAALEVPAALGVDALHRAAIVKHTVPCGVAERATVADAVRRRSTPIRSRPTAVSSRSMGRSIVAAAEALGEFFLEIVAAPAFEPDALALLATKEEPAHHALRAGDAAARSPRNCACASALGGVLAEDDDPARPPNAGGSSSDRAPSDAEWRDLVFAWDVVRHVKSNGVTVVRDGVTRGICAGQTNRVSAVLIAGGRAGDYAQGAACASDGFFPFADGLIAAAEAGCTAVIAPSGSIRDAEVDRGGQRTRHRARLLDLSLLPSLTMSCGAFIARLFVYCVLIYAAGGWAQREFLQTGLDQNVEVQPLWLIGAWAMLAGPFLSVVLDAVARPLGALVAGLLVGALLTAPFAFAHALG